MISKFLKKLKSILFKSSVNSETPTKKTKKKNNSSKTTKKPTKATKKPTKATKKPTKTTKTKSKKSEAKKVIEILTTLPGVGDKSAKALYQAGFKTADSVIAADEKSLLKVPGVGINLVKKLKNLK